MKFKNPFFNRIRPTPKGKEDAANKISTASFVSAEEDIGGATAVGIGQGQSLIPSPVLKKKEAEEAYYNDGSFDVDQQLAIQIAKEDGIDLLSYITPDNSPEQMLEIVNAIKLGIPDEKVRMLANPAVSYMAIQAINRAWKAGYDLTKYLPWADPFVLNQAYLAAKKGLNLDLIIKKGYDHRQIEQMRKELEAGGDPSTLSGNYNRMRAHRFPGHNISNMDNPVPKGQGTSTHNKRKS